MTKSIVDALKEAFFAGGRTLMVHTKETWAKWTCKVMIWILYGILYVYNMYFYILYIVCYTTYIHIYIHIFIQINMYEMRAELTWLHDVIYGVLPLPVFYGVQVWDGLCSSVQDLFQWNILVLDQMWLSRPDVTFPDRSKYIGKMWLYSARCDLATVLVADWKIMVFCCPSLVADGFNTFSWWILTASYQLPELNNHLQDFSLLLNSSEI